MRFRFGHVANELLRRVLENKPEYLRMEDIEQAVGRTLNRLAVMRFA
jgi:hypothetical protein